MISINVASMALNFRGGRHGHLALTMTIAEYITQTGFPFFMPHNPGNYVTTMGTAQEQVIETEKF